jgi:hypothetical protein
MSDECKVDSLLFDSENELETNLKIMQETVSRCVKALKDMNDGLMNKEFFSLSKNFRAISDFVSDNVMKHHHEAFPQLDRLVNYVKDSNRFNSLQSIRKYMEENYTSTEYQITNNMLQEESFDMIKTIFAGSWIVKLLKRLLETSLRGSNSIIFSPFWQGEPEEENICKLLLCSGFTVSTENISGRGHKRGIVIWW